MKMKKLFKKKSKQNKDPQGTHSETTQKSFFSKKKIFSPKKNMLQEIVFFIHFHPYRVFSRILCKSLNGHQ